MTILALVWTLFSLVGLAFSVAGLFDALLDLAALGPIRNGRRQLARSDVKAQAGLIVVEVVWLLLGIGTLIGIAGGMLVVLGLVATNVMIALVAAQRYYDHAALVDQLVKQIEEERNKK